MESIQPLLAWIGDHPSLAALAVFLIAFGESLALIGIIMPGALLMVGLGTLIALGALDFWMVYSFAVLGAIAGDGASFWLGTHFRERLLEFWPFNRYQSLVNRGKKFFEKHGVKSVILGRFIGPIRPILPAIAGIMRMPVRTYLVANIGSAIFWAPAYLLPGYAIGFSLELALTTASRLVFALLLLFVACLLVFWVIRSLYLFAQNRAAWLRKWILILCQKHPKAKSALGFLLDPEHPEARGLFTFTLILLGATWVSSLLIWDLWQIQPPTELDLLLQNLLQELRDPITDRLMIIIGSAGELSVLSFLVLSVSLWLGWLGHKKILIYWLATYLFAVITPPLLGWLLTGQQLSLTAGEFPAAKIFRVTTVFGFLTILIAREIRKLPHWLAYSGLGLILILTAASDLYLGIHWFSATMAGLSLAIAWISMTGIAFLHHVPAGSLPAKKLVILTSFLLITASTIDLTFGLEQRENARNQQPPQVQLASQIWQDTRWQNLPVYRADLRGKSSQPFNLQWTGELGDIRQLLIRKGWKTGNEIALQSAVQWLNPGVIATQLPLFPQAHKGRHESLILVKRLPETLRLLQLRLWNTGIQIEPLNTPLWIGYIGYAQQEKSLGFINYMRTSTEFDAAKNRLASDLDTVTITSKSRQVVSVHQSTPKIGWNAEVLLVKQQRESSGSE